VWTFAGRGGEECGSRLRSWGDAGETQGTDMFNHVNCSAQEAQTSTANIYTSKSQPAARNEVSINQSIIQTKPKARFRLHPSTISN
jgi:hypothetical protein